MKGEIFVGFVELVEDRFGVTVADRILSNPKLASGGAYTRTGTYDHDEMVRLVVALAEVTEADPAVLQRAFGHYLFGRLVAWHSDFLNGVTDTFSLVRTIENTIHVNVRKLYPDADPPEILVSNVEDDALMVRYKSDKGFAHVCHGLLEGCIEYFGDPVIVKRVDASTGPLDRTAQFMLKQS